MMLSLHLAWRQFRQGHLNRLQRFLRTAAVAGVALGCLVLVLVLSVMNGFQQVLTERFLSLVPQVELTSVNGELQRPLSLTSLAQADDRVLAVAPFRAVNALAVSGEHLNAVILRGIDLEKEMQVSGIKSFITPQMVKAFEAEPNSLILGAALADKLGAKVGSEVSLLVAPPGSGGLSTPRRHRLTLVGVVKVGGQLDYSLAYMPLATANQWNGSQKAQGLRLKVKDVFAADQVARDVGYRAHEGLYMDNWTRTQGHLYQDIQMVRVIIYLVVGLIMLVASFNIVSLLMVTVREEAPQIAMLRSIGCRQGTVSAIFLWRGCMLGGLGVLLGTGLGLLLAMALPELVSGWEWLTGSTVLAGDIYFTDTLPTQIRLGDALVTASLALFVSLAATLYPALHAARLQPARVLSGS
ncbi:ABC transporter permease [Gallaecimonas kandeliae]|uniref:ABC transporter permease n=1 Tax=Gallaecimonas kandeliae TaxID=3029055 RepID=UPI002648D1D2|nr:ABC transporter permease [Gallaecimonas kandeliae]WKE67045.1 ABC transporter permease [Gallaecimonas kandeliae]